MSKADSSNAKRPALTTSASQKKGGRKAAYYWAHVGTGDMMSQAIGHNQAKLRARQADASKRGPIPVIARDEKAFSDLTDAKNQFVTKAESDLIGAAETHAAAVKHHQVTKMDRQDVKRGLDPNYVSKEEASPARPARRFDPGTLMGLPEHRALYDDITKGKKRLKTIQFAAEASRREYSGRLNAALDTDILRASDAMGTLDPKRSKLYILGHGGADMAAISPTESDAAMISLRKVAAGLRAAPLHLDFEDIRMQSCHSADARKPQAFVPGFDPPGVTGGTFGFFRAHAPAQVMANELARQGFNHPQVTGYQGVGMTNPDGNHQLRRPNANSPEASETRANTVKKVFTPFKK